MKNRNSIPAQAPSVTAQAPRSIWCREVEVVYALIQKPRAIYSSAAVPGGCRGGVPPALASAIEMPAIPIIGTRSSNVNAT